MSVTKSNLNPEIIDKISLQTKVTTAIRTLKQSKI